MRHSPSPRSTSGAAVSTAAARIAPVSEPSPPSTTNTTISKERRNEKLLVWT